MLAGCSSTSLPTGQNVSASNSQSHVRHLNMGPCPASGITMATGNNGTWTVGIGDSCDMYAPMNEPCNTGEFGETYHFIITGGASYGSLGQSGNEGTFTRTSKGEVDITLQQWTYEIGDFHCASPMISTYGTIHFTTP
jgi:hypothetical protein